MNAELTRDRVGDLLRESTRLSPVSTSPVLDCQLLLAHVLGVERSWLYAHADDAPHERQIREYMALLDRRAAGEPVAYLIGKQSFWTMALEVDSSTLIPRPETERLVETILAKLDRNTRIRVADLGTGSGAIAIALARECPLWQIIATDRSLAALAVARRNAVAWGADIELRAADWLNGFEPGSLDAIISNPPYVCENDEHLTALGYEPRDALVAGSDGLAAIRTLVADSFAVLRSGGWLMLEHGYDQQAAVMELMQGAGFERIEGLGDLAGLPRVAIGARP